MADTPMNAKAPAEPGMVEVLTRELDGLALDWVVAKCEGLLTPAGRLTDEYCDSLRHDSDGGVSSDWSQGGPIIQRERIELCSYSNDGVDTAFRSMGDERGNYSHEEEYVISVPEVVVWTAWVKYGSYKQDGPTPLIAAMRCFVASRLGDKVEVPRKLVQRVTTVEAAAPDSHRPAVDEAPARERNRGCCFRQPPR